MSNSQVPGHLQSLLIASLIDDHTFRKPQRALSLATAWNFIWLRHQVDLEGKQQRVWALDPFAVKGSDAQMAKSPVIGLLSPLNEKHIFFFPTSCSSIQVITKRTYEGGSHTWQVFEGEGPARRGASRGGHRVADAFVLQGQPLFVSGTTGVGLKRKPVGKEAFAARRRCGQARPRTP